ncbi:MAG: YkgJ family cysteine cluster protein [Candidatus Methanomethylicia archaeon]|nr:YkgJ family cysteine cluster protein [Candidatus Methanomethylicia archaeon]MCX8168836.1 YkgJ family cysteine cluster protein [Candidatus Methanomethylicia archaeon]MDW7988568.1 YkgJ family cysteine cluster protein [Nitrososphaerota archaeon]
MYVRGAEKYIPWKESGKWRCIRCGKCCVAYIVPLKTHEALSLMRTYGSVVVYYDGRYYLSKKADNSCIFLTKIGNIAYCINYLERPLCCKLYPFHISRRPIEGLSEKNAEINIYGKKLYLYVDALCPGIGQGYSIENFIMKIYELWRLYGTTI